MARSLDLITARSGTETGDHRASLILPDSATYGGSGLSSGAPGCARLRQVAPDCCQWSLESLFPMATAPLPVDSDPLCTGEAPSRRPLVELQPSGLPKVPRGAGQRAGQLDLSARPRLPEARHSG
eukprot:6077696-Prymnesium_polylepis.1